MEYKDRVCIVLDKISISNKLFLILKEQDNNKTFEILASPSLYSTSDKGDILILSLRDFDIKQTMQDNMIFLVGSLLSLGLAISFLIALIIDNYISMSFS